MPQVTCHHCTSYPGKWASRECSQCHCYDSGSATNLNKNTLFTIGFTKKSAEQFFALIRNNGITMLADIRLNNTGQLAGYTKAKDLAFFLSLVSIKYQHWKDFAPTKELRTAYHTDWDFEKYATQYSKLIGERGAVQNISGNLIRQQKICLLCSEPTHENCHRSVAADLIGQSIPDLEIKHL